MIIVYDLDTKDILSTEDNTIIPAFPIGDTAEKVSVLKSEGRGFVSVPYELGLEVLDYRLVFNDANEFVGLQPKNIDVE